MARIVTVSRGAPTEFRPTDMSLIRWLKISEALARKGHQVDIAWTTPEGDGPCQLGPNLKRVALDQVSWNDYDVVKVLFHFGFETLEAQGAADHPFIISKLGSVVGPEDRPGVFFYGEERDELYQTQLRINAASRYITLLTEESKELWLQCFPEARNVLLVPGATDLETPPIGQDPFPLAEELRCIYAGHIYHPWRQPEAHGILVNKLNGLGRLLRERGAMLYYLGPGTTDALDSLAVASLGAVPHDQSWDFIRHADVGLVLAFGPEKNVNESTKIYQYLRGGLPCVCERGFPNEGLIEQAELGILAPNGDLTAMADAIMQTARTNWNREAAAEFVKSHHTWDSRAKVYDQLLRSESL